MNDVIEPIVSEQVYEMVYKFVSLTSCLKFNDCRSNRFNRLPTAPVLLVPVASMGIMAPTTDLIKRLRSTVIIALPFIFIVLFDYDVRFRITA
ncbi:hypothetical protein PCANC_10954 [Puccinia coronata f. sp. avenae]|uniref:Uncharacterized protein n=1 Tax=Puccinia coronata f. sp. avenae TaxID=200324 RepID=A0A2N5UWT4_9BASI|nr:hypothetical protein PCANC_10954 [Puccinia coronata f. sp. avenae]